MDRYLLPSEFEVMARFTEGGEASRPADKAGKEHTASLHTSLKMVLSNWRLLLATAFKHPSRPPD
eukprot:CAMPEP_0175386018 /NCGR_PEP_ID=MMETSP0095-20121207/29144_1 /TAXON_ID=311494 /ORGANISM="Alexandrium monilatum, Strain CCMP3105" /LENGTH=64 /DNA_ID=CAMNT_0016684459 /DNA_START=172 /DNA_END=363 /DNA_ORIENTATION=+